MIDLGLKAPSLEIIVANLLAAGVMQEALDGPQPVAGVGFDFIGQIVRTPTVLEGAEEVAPAVLTSDVHANLRLYGDDADALFARLKDRTLIALKADPDDEAPVAEGRADGFKWFMLDQLETPARVWA